MGRLRRYQSLDRNGKGMLCNILFAFLVKGGSLLVSLLTAPAFLRYFGSRTVLGVWYTLLSLLLWFLNFDLGLGNGLRDRLTKDLSRKDWESAGKTLSSGMFANAVLTLALTVLGGLVLSTVDLNRLFGVQEREISRQTLRAAVNVVFLGMMLRFFLSWVGAALQALQMASVNNFLALCVSVLQLCFLLLAKPENPERGLLELAAGYALLSNLPVGLAGILLLGTKLKDCRPSRRKIGKDRLRQIMGVGSGFFVCQIAYMLILNTNEVLISRLFGPACTTEYTFYYKLTTLVSMVFSPAVTPICSAVAKAVAEKNYRWVRRLYRWLKFAGLLAAAGQFAFLPVQQFAMDLWLGEESFPIDYGVAAVFACFGSAFTYGMILSAVVSGMARLRLQMACYAVGAAAKMLLLPLLAPLAGHWSAVVWCNALVLAVYCVLQQRDLDRCLRIENTKNGRVCGGGHRSQDGMSAGIGADAGV